MPHSLPREQTTDGADASSRPRSSDIGSGWGPIPPLARSCMSNKPSAAKVPTNIEGLDNILLGGFLREGFCLVQGDPGSGKTTLALQFVQGRAKARERCLYISL